MRYNYALQYETKNPCAEWEASAKASAIGLHTDSLTYKLGHLVKHVLLFGK